MREADVPGPDRDGALLTGEPALHRVGGFLCAVDGIFLRTVHRDHARAALLGSHREGRYSRSEQPTLYLSASRAGVEAAMIAHRTDAERDRVVLNVAVSGGTIFDLRDADALARVRDAAGDPFADWQEAVARGREPPSWRARDWIEGLGAHGLIDPSRKAPGLWHLVLFRWNVAGAPSVHL